MTDDGHENGFIHVESRTYGICICLSGDRKHKQDFNYLVEVTVTR